MRDSLKNSSLPLGEILKFLKNFWGDSNVQVAVVASLAFQVLLVFCAPFRKRSKKSRTLVILWLVYLLSHYVATFAIGLINNYGTDEYNQQNSVVALWAPFLLLHLGGPDTITAFSIEDNDLWLRYLLTLIVQLLSVLFVFYRFKIHANDEFLIPTILTFAAGVIKYGENIRSLNLASTVSMRKSMRENVDRRSAKERLQFEEEEIGLATETDKHERDIKIVTKGYELYQKYKAVIVDHVFSFTLREESRGFFLHLPSYKEAFEVTQVELNFMYDAMFTKMIAVQGNIPGYLFRVGCAALIISTLIVFIFHPKHNVSHHDIQVTYCLVGSAVVLDLIALVKHFFCDWTIALMMNNEKWRMKARKRGAKIVNKVRRWISAEMRWSEEIQQYSLIKHSLKKQWKISKKIFEFFGLTERMEASKNTKTDRVDENLKAMIFNEIKKKAARADTDENAEEIYSYRGESVLEDCQQCREKIRPRIAGAQYDNVVLMWHIATEICYFTAQKEELDPNVEICRKVSEYLAYLLMMEGKITSAVPGNVGMRFRDICWQEVRDTHLHLRQYIRMKKIDEDQMPEWERKRKRREEIEKKKEELKQMKSFYRYPEYQINSVWKEMKKMLPQNVKLDNAETRMEITEWERKQKKKEFEARKEVCQFLVEENTKRNFEGHYEPPRKSLLYEAVALARMLKELIDGGEDAENPTAAAAHNPDAPQKNHVWEMMARVWVEMLCYGACHCRGDVQYLTKGGELLTFVRLLMAHFGIGKQFKKEDEDTAMRKFRKKGSSPSISAPTTSCDSSPETDHKMRKGKRFSKERWDTDESLGGNTSDSSDTSLFSSSTTASTSGKSSRSVSDRKIPSPRPLIINFIDPKQAGVVNEEPSFRGHFVLKPPKPVKAVKEQFSMIPARTVTRTTAVTKRYNNSNLMWFIVISLMALVFWGKTLAILCTSAWLYMVPRFSHSPEIHSDEVYWSKIVKERMSEQTSLSRRRLGVSN
nr:uncharacterized protein LOC109190268 [Ipomoea batatas]